MLGGLAALFPFHNQLLFNSDCCWSLMRGWNTGFTSNSASWTIAHTDGTVEYMVFTCKACSVLTAGRPVLIMAVGNVQMADDIGIRINCCRSTSSAISWWILWKLLPLWVPKSGLCHLLLACSAAFIWVHKSFLHDLDL